MALSPAPVTTSIVAIEITDRENAAVLMNGRGWRDAHVLDSTYVSALLTVINLREPRHKRARHVIIVPDNINTEDFRKLRVYLRWSYRDRRTWPTLR